MKERSAQQAKKNIPLAQRMRPRTLEEFVGQEELLGENTLLRMALENHQLPSLILWGPPGSGKTTLALLLSREFQSEFVALSAVGSGVKELRGVFVRAEECASKGVSTILFVDEVHRWNKSQQDALLPYVERGIVTLVGATTENPSFEVNPALLSRTRVVILKPLGTEVIVSLLRRALVDEERGLGGCGVSADDDVLRVFAEASGGDARAALGFLDVASFRGGHIDMNRARHILLRPHFAYDKGGEEHYNIISALHKSLRGNDANAALYWLARMLEAGEDPLYIARRLVRFASEDIGIANSLALPQTVAVFEVCRSIGMPECSVHLAQAVVYLARSKKSNALYVAYEKAKRDAHNFPREPVPIHLRNAPTKLLRELGYGKEYKYTPEYKNADDAKQEFFPERLAGREYLRFEENHENRNISC